jgi:hypothetical protein
VKKGGEREEDRVRARGSGPGEVLTLYVPCTALSDEILFELTIT